MFLMDVNVLVYAYREDANDHIHYRHWLEGVINSDSAYGFSELVLSGFLRVVTHPKVFEVPSSVTTALAFVNQLKSQPNAVRIQPGDMHWQIFQNLLEKTDAKGNLIPDAFHAALAIEAGCEWITTDKGFKKFKGLKFSHPLS